MNASEIHHFVSTAWPNECLSVSQIRAVCQQFREGRDSFERKRGSGKHKSEIRMTNMYQVSLLIQEDSRITV